MLLSKPGSFTRPCCILQSRSEDPLGTASFCRLGDVARWMRQDPVSPACRAIGINDVSEMRNLLRPAPRMDMDRPRHDAFIRLGLGLGSTYVPASGSLPAFYRVFEGSLAGSSTHPVSQQTSHRIEKRKRHPGPTFPEPSSRRRRWSPPPEPLQTTPPSRRSNSSSSRFSLTRTVRSSSAVQRLTCSTGRRSPPLLKRKFFLSPFLRPCARVSLERVVLRGSLIGADPWVGRGCRSRVGRGCRYIGRGCRLVGRGLRIIFQNMQK
ncbi:hypothetical protein QO005_004695 [Rhizobium paknamense]|uniref:Uncharacterized protein n=1 Tax=Rhizobium paknamense TaxID=1206817 RepID=A0ABU0IMB2_9HYPH|nr:hypothetical protein [Rhizobium paknamense]